jgi:regulator of protease activity HflC (stomatin/prohibitin superfamily)
MNNPATPPVPAPGKRPGVSLPLVAASLFACAVAAFIGAACLPAHAGVAGLDTLGAALLIAGSGFIGEALLAEARARPREFSGPGRAGDSKMGQAMGVSGALRVRLHQIDWMGGWLPIATAFFGNLIAGLIVLATWRSGTASFVAVSANASSQQQVLGCILLVAGLPLLVLNRIFARSGRSTAFSTIQLAILLRVPLVACAAGGVACLIRSLGYEWPFLIDRALMILVGLVAVEIALRSAASLFIPMASLQERRSSANSGIAWLIGPRWPGMAAVNSAVLNHFGIDLSRSWAFPFLARAALPMLAGLAFFGWLMSGLTVLGIDQRAVYERFGRPVSVAGPGLHAHLPWPFGIMRKVEFGVVHQIPIIFPAQGDESSIDASASDPVSAPVAVEDVPPASGDRLWDVAHPFEASYLIASASSGQQGFQIVNIDLRIAWRATLSDAGALASAYRVADPEPLIRAAAGRILVTYFSRRTLADVLGENRTGFVSGFRAQLQERLDALDIGTEIVAVIVEGIHPPPEAARAYHHVQAAQIQATARVSQSHGEASLSLGRARQSAATMLGSATADATEQVAQAQAAQTLFGGDHRAWLQSGQVFLDERWLSRLQADLGQSPVVIVDQRLTGAGAPTIDLRRFGTVDSVPSVVPDR